MKKKSKKNWVRISIFTHDDYERALSFMMNDEKTFSHIRKNAEKKFLASVRSNTHLCMHK